MDGEKRLAALQDAALAVSSARGERIFAELTRYLAAILHCELALIGAVNGERVRTLGVHGVKGYLENFEYPLATTPCGEVIGKAFMIVPDGVVERYPEDELLADFGAVGYAGYPLNDSTGRAVGVLAILSKKPLINHTVIEAVLKIFAVRAEAELERCAHEEALAGSAEQYRAIFNAAADSLVLRDAEFRVVDVNPAYEAMSGRSREEAIGREGLTMSPESLNEHARGLHARALAGEHVKFEAIARRKNGERFHIETRGVPIQYRGLPHVLYIGRDVTVQKIDEQVLRSSEEQYRAIFNAAADALVLRDDNARVVDVNTAMTVLSGYSREAGSRGPRGGGVGGGAAVFLPPPRQQRARGRDAPPRDRRRVGALRGSGHPQGRHADRRRDARGADALSRQAARAGHGARHHCPQARRGRARRAGSAAPPGAEDGGDRPPHRRHRARLQQPAREHHGLRGAGRGTRSRGRRPEARPLSRAGARLLAPRARPYPADADLQPRPARRAARGRPRRDGRALGEPGARLASGDHRDAHRA